MHWLVPVFLLALVAGHTHPCHAALIIDQIGNLIENGNFESGEVDPWRQNDAPTVSLSSTFTIDGSYAALVDTTTAQPGDKSVGLWQYPGLFSGTELPEAIYTASAWFYPLEGQAHVGIAWNTGINSAFSAPTTLLNQWQYLEIAEYKAGLGGPLLYGLSDQDRFYVDGVWLNTGAENQSPYSPRNGFPDPSASPIIPELSTMWYAMLGFLSVIVTRWTRKMGKTRLAQCVPGIQGDLRSLAEWRRYERLWSGNRG